MPRLRTETFGGGDFTWLGSTHGIGNARTETLNTSAFTKATHYPDGYIKSGTPVALVAGLLVPYDATPAAEAGAGILAGFVLTDQAVVDPAAKIAVPLLDHGRVKTSKLPVAFTAPTGAKRGETTFVFTN